MEVQKWVKRDQAEEVGLGNTCCVTSALKGWSRTAEGGNSSESNLPLAPLPSPPPPPPPTPPPIGSLECSSNGCQEKEAASRLRHSSSLPLSRPPAYRSIRRASTRHARLPYMTRPWDNLSPATLSNAPSIEALNCPQARSLAEVSSFSAAWQCMELVAKGRGCATRRSWALPYSQTTLQLDHPTARPPNS